MPTFTITTGDPAKTFTVTGNVTITENDPTVVVVPPPPPVDTTGFKVGVNSFPWFPLRLLDDIGMRWHRCYLSSGWIWQPGGLAVQPMHQAETQENHGIDEMLEKAKAFGIKTLLCIHQTPEWYRNTGRGDGNNDYAPIKQGAKRDDPASYKDYAGFLFQVAARYGRTKHTENSLRVDKMPRWSGDILNVKRSGLDLLNYIEPWNEPDKWWKKGTSESEAYFEPEETAAMMSACYDGHEGTLGAGVGIKTADPSMIVVMPGLTDFDLKYIQEMNAWFVFNRKDRKWPCDVMNVHHYSNAGNKNSQIPAQWVSEGACTPVNDANFLSIFDVENFATGIGKKLWVTEFGADKVAPSMMLAKGVGRSNEKFQSDIIIETIKAYKAAGVDGVFIFNAPDENSGSDGGQFETCGIFSSEATGYKPFIAANELRAYLLPIKSMVGRPKTTKNYSASEFKRPLKK